MLRTLTEIYMAHRRSREPWRPQQAGLGRDRRVFYRVSVQLPCKLANPQFGLESAAITIDASLEGLGLIAPVNWSEGSRIHIFMETLPFDADATIVYRRQESPQFRYGLKFCPLGLLQIVKLRQFLKKNHSGRLSE